MAKKKPARGQPPPSSPRSPSPAALQMLAPWLEELRRRYEEYSDPFYLWEAYRAFRGLRMAIPDWVLSYLDRVAAHIGVIEATTTVTQYDKKTGIVYARARRHVPLPSLLGAALEMTEDGAGTLLSRRLNRRSDAQLAFAVSCRVAENGGKEKAAVDYVARMHHTSESTVGRAWRALKATGRLPTS